jgi:hypothetical protein
MQHAAEKLNLALPPYGLFFPSIAEYTALLEAQNLETTWATLFDRPTPLEGADGMRNWVRMFGAHTFAAVPNQLRDEFLTLAEEFARPHLFRDGTWFADYRRLRLIANKIG